MSSDDLKSHALNSSQDFYALLGISEGATDSEIRTAYRKTARKYHPDKVGANEEALKTFHLLQIAYDVLSDSTVKELYDNARRAKQAKADRDKAYEGRRKQMKEELERRENAAFKRKREATDEEVQFERELTRLQEDGKRRRKEREEMLRREEEEERKKYEEDTAPEPENGPSKGKVDEIDRSITLRFPQNDSTSHIDRAELIRRFERFGSIEEVILRDKKIKIEGEKHRKPYRTALIAYKSVVGAHAAVTDLRQLAKSDSDYENFEAINWAAGQPPAFIPPSKPPETMRKSHDAAKISKFTEHVMPVGIATDGSRKVPSFASFKGTRAKDASSPNADDIMMIRLKNAEKKRMEEKIRREEAEADAAENEDV